MNGPSSLFEQRQYFDLNFSVIKISLSSMPKKWGRRYIKANESYSRDRQKSDRFMPCLVEIST